MVQGEIVSYLSFVVLVVYDARSKMDLVPIPNPKPKPKQTTFFYLKWPWNDASPNSGPRALHVKLEACEQIIPAASARIISIIKRKGKCYHSILHKSS